MNDLTATQTVTETTFDGPLSLSTTLLLAVVLLAVFAWSLYRERHVLGSRTTIGFAVLRLICLATILWMLLAPTRVLVETDTTPRTIAIVADTSASMTTVDPPGTADEIRWIAAKASGSTLSDEPGSVSAMHPVVLSDNALVSLGIADRELVASIEAVRQHRPDQQVAKSIAATQKAIQRCGDNVQRLRLASLVDHEQSQQIEPVLRNAKRLLQSPEFQNFQTLAKRLSAGRTPRQSDWRESLRDLQHRVRGTLQVLQELSRLVADAESQAIATYPQNSRIERVATFLGTLKKQTLESMDRSVNIRWSQFSKVSQNLDDVESPHLSLLGQVADVNGSPAESHSQSVAMTNLSSALLPLRSNESQIPIAAAFVFSDVAHNDTGTVGVSDDPGPDVSDEGTTSARTHFVKLPTEVAASLGETPVYIIPIGNANRLRDVNLVGVDSPTVAMRNDDIVVEAHLEAYQCQGDRCTVQLLDGADVVDFREIQFDSDFVSRTIRFQRRVSEIGEASLSVVVSGVDGEMTQTNNLRKVIVNVTRNQIKVLLADEMPRWEFRYLAQLFRRDPKVECDEMLFRPRLIATGDRQSSRTFPTTVDQWDEYDVVILGDLPPEHLPVAAQESLAEYLRHRGGTLVMIAGSRAMPDAFAKSPLAELLPVTKTNERLRAPEGFAFQATREGRSHVALMIGETQQATQTAWDFVNRFSPLHDVSSWRRPKPTAKNLIAVVPRRVGVPRKGAAADAAPRIAGDEMPENQDSFLCWQPIGRGRVVYFSGPDTYRLRFLRGDRYHYRFWGQMLRWAIASELSSGAKQVRLRTDKTDYQSGQDVDVEVRLSGDDGVPLVDQSDVSLRVTSGDIDEQISLRADEEIPGLYHGQVNSPRAGVYAVTPVGDFIDQLPESETAHDLGLSFTVQADIPMELSDTRCDRVLASQITELTGGQVLPPSAVAEVLALTDLEPIVTQTIQQTPLWSQWKYLWLVFGCLQTEWIIRKWRGLS
ncbi:hypothetical protein [Planctomycetes bacterium K23_9]|uniref:Glutamine amidotransferase domain-containing protein n=1 Tax=Stieleria marina TaxID=1930275 RepID=A0A517P0M6_9BACT|nr:hypothetical protein K239x_49410 [Planctomycetes bacterium K23_9]